MLCDPPATRSGAGAETSEQNSAVHAATTDHRRGQGVATKTRRSVLQGGVALTGTLALGFPTIVRAQADKIKIGHLTPLTGFLGALGAYAQLGIRMAAEEINASGGVMGRQLD